MSGAATCWEEVYRAQTARIAELDAENAALRAELKIMEHRVITCGVAATHSDINLTLGYPKEWDSQQAEQVRSLRAENAALRAASVEFRDACWDAFHLPVPNVKPYYALVKKHAGLLPRPVKEAQQ